PSDSGYVPDGDPDQSIVLEVIAATGTIGTTERTTAVIPLLSIRGPSLPGDERSAASSESGSLATHGVSEFVPDRIPRQARAVSVPQAGSRSRPHPGSRD